MTTTIALNSGADLPLIGFGTWKAPPDEVRRAVCTALQSGVRLIDCAWAYDNEEAVGQGIRESGVRREEIFITTKLWSTFHTRVEEGLQASLRRLGTNYVDLFLTHWPVALAVRGTEKMPLRADGSRDVDEQRRFADTWRDMEALLATGSARAIGVSNMSEALIDELRESARIPPAVCQLECHPFLPEHDLVAYLRGKGIAPQAYSPLGSGAADVLANADLQRIAVNHAVEPAQIALAWQCQRGVAVVPKSVTPSRILSNARINVRLSDDEMRFIDALHRQPGQHRRILNPPWGVDLRFKTCPHGAAAASA